MRLEKEIDLYTLNALCILYDVEIFIIRNNNSYTIFNKKNNNQVFLYENIIKIDYNNLSTKSNSYDLDYNTNFSENEIKKIINNYYYLSDINKPLRSLSYYKYDDLIEICKKLSIENNKNNKKLTKKEIYEEITKIIL